MIVKVDTFILNPLFNATIARSFSTTKANAQKRQYVKNIKVYRCKGGARGVMVIVVGNGRGDSSSNPGRD